MVRIDIDITDGCITRLWSQGHDEVGPGELSLVCGIVSAILRTAVRLVESREEITWCGEAPNPGEMFLLIEECPVETKAWLQGITDFILKGIGDLQTDFPDKVTLNVRSD